MTHLDLKKIEADASDMKNAALWSLLLGAVSGIAAWIDRLSQRRRLMAELAGADGRVLAEIGISRGDISAVADGSWQGHLETRHDARFPRSRSGKILTMRKLAEPDLVWQNCDCRRAA